MVSYAGHLMQRDAVGALSHAERRLRPLVTARKISGGTRSDRGTATKLALATLIGTWRLQGCDPYLACRQLLLSPQV